MIVGVAENLVMWGGWGNTGASGRALFPIYPRNGRWDLGISVVLFFVVIPVPFTRLLCVLAACTFVVRRVTWKAGAFLHSFPYLPEWSSISPEITQQICIRG